MSTANTIFDFIKSVNQSQGLITLWRPDSSEKRWYTANNGDPSSLIKSNKFSFFIVPYPLIWVDDSNNGKFHFGRQWTMQKKEIGLEDNSTVENDNTDKEKIIPEGSPAKTYPIWRQMKSSSELYANLQTDPVIWLPFVIIPADGSEGSYARKVFFTPLHDSVLN